MLRRIFQVMHALTAKMESSDHRLVTGNLDSREQSLFYAMDINSQKHSVKVALTCLQLAASYPLADRKLLVRAALLHDIGKQRGDLTTLDRIIFVITGKLFPRLSKALAKQGNGFSRQKLQHAFFVLEAHPVLGRQKAAAVGVEPQILELIARHHTPQVPGEPLELTILRNADDLN
ncbi:MAG: HD domain-containing protein [Clostridia bacterium]|nr:HD domain-containing protein [Clostridia bacterium]